MRNAIFQKLMIVGLTISLGSACSTTKLLNADFENNSQQGDFPVLNLPGDPIGDRISWDGPQHDPSESINPLQIGGTGALNYFITRANTNTPSLLGFVPRSDSFDKGVYTITWKMTIPRREKPLNIRITSNNSYQSDPILDIGFWPNSDTRVSEQRWMDYYIIYGDEFDNERPSLGQPNGRIRSGLEIGVSLIINIETREYLISLPGFTDRGPEEIVFRSTQLNHPPSMWFSFGDEILGTGQLELRDIIITHARSAD